MPDVNLEIKQISLTLVNFLRLFAMMYLICQTSVSGYCTAEAAHSIAHAWALILPLLSAITVQNVMRFHRRSDEVLLAIRLAYKTVLLSLLSNLAAIGLFGYELHQGVSYFYVQSKPFLISTIVVTVFMLVCDVGVGFCLQAYEGALPLLRKKLQNKKD
jgi:hypothetical protein